MFYPIFIVFFLSPFPLLFSSPPSNSSLFFNLDERARIYIPVPIGALVYSNELSLGQEQRHLLEDANDTSVGSFDSLFLLGRLWL